MEGSKKRYRGYVFTHNNYVDTLVEDGLECKYIVYGKEVGENGTPHLQGFVYFFSGITVSAARKKLVGSHVEIADDIGSAILYCKKGEQTKDEWKKYHESGPNYGKNAVVVERGVKPATQEEKGEKGKEYWENVMKKIEEGKEDELDARLRFSHAKTIDYLINKKKRKLEDTEERHQWYYGTTGTGKSRTARRENPDAYLKMCNKWWDLYNDEPVVIIEDFDKEHKVLCHHLKIWSDRYPFLAEVKGGARKIRPKKIIVTSNWHPNEIWDDAKDLEPIMRRFGIREFKKVLPVRVRSVPSVVSNGVGNLKPIAPKTVIQGNTQVTTWDDETIVDFNLSPEDLDLL